MDKKIIRKRTEEVINTNAIITSTTDFLATHVPFKELKFCNSGISNDISNKYSEEELFNDFILNNMDKHNFIVIQGDNGSGKSHFIRWLKYKYDNELRDSNEVSILIERNNNTLQATIKQLLSNETIQELIGKEELQKLITVDSNLTNNNFLTMIALNFASKVLDEEDLDCILNSRKRKSLYAFLSNEVVLRNLLLCKNGPIYRIGKKISNKEDEINLKEDARFVCEDFNFSLTSKLMKDLHEDEADRKVINFAEDLVDDKRNIRSVVSEYLNSKLESVIQDSIRLNSSDLKNMIDNIRIELQKKGKNLTLFIEDITSFTGIDKALIENIIREHNEENGLCRLFSIIGITNGYYQSSLPDNLKDRITGRIIIDKDSIFGDEEALLDIASRYINAIYLTKEEIDNWINKGANEAELPLYKPTRWWSVYKNTEGREFNLYPLNRQAIINLYSMLQIQTPRMFINEIIKPIFIKFTEEKTQFPQSVDELSGFIRIPELISPLYIQEIDKEITDNSKERTKALLRIWGNGTIDTQTMEDGNKYIGGVPETIFDEFSVPKISGRKVNTQSNIGKNISENINTMKNNILSKETNKKVVSSKPIINEISKEEKKFNKIKADLDEWIVGKSLLKQHSDIRDYIIGFIKEAIYWDMEGVSSYLVEEVITKKNIVIEKQNSKSELSTSAFCIEKNEENYYFIFALCQYNTIGKKKWNYSDAIDGILTVTKWIEKNKEKIISYVKKYNTNEYDVYKYVLLNKYYFQAMSIEKSIKKLDGYNKYAAIINNNIDLNNPKFNQILGEDINKLKIRESLIKENNDFILKFYNCIQGDVSNINKTDIYYFDAKEIIERIEYLNNNKWRINDNLSIEKNNTIDKYLIPLKLYKDFINNELVNIVDSRYSDIISIVNEYKSIIGIEDNIDEIRYEVNKLYKVMKNSNIYYDSELYSNFDILFIQNYEADKIVSILESGLNGNLLGKIDRLKHSMIISMKQYLEVIKMISKMIDKIYNENNNLNDLIENKRKLINKKDEFKNEIIEMRNELVKVNGGDINVIK